MTRVTKSALNEAVVTVRIDIDGETREVPLSRGRWRWAIFSQPHPEIQRAPTSKQISKYARLHNLAAAVSSDKIHEPFCMTFNGCSLSAADFLSIHGDSWFSDAIIEAFGKQLLSVSSHKDGVGFLYLSSHVLIHAKSSTSYDEQKLKQLLNGLELHDFDSILWPIHNDNHWQLCVARPATRQASLLEPYTLKDGKLMNRKLNQYILRGLSLLFYNYDEMNEVKLKWSLKADYRLATALNLPVQPTNDSSSCGVLVCCYLWCIVTGLHWPFSTSKRVAGIGSSETFPQRIKSIRTVIGGIIATNSYLCK